VIHNWKTKNKVLFTNFIGCLKIPKTKTSIIIINFVSFELSVFTIELIKNKLAIIVRV